MQFSAINEIDLKRQFTMSARSLKSRFNAHGIESSRSRSRSLIHLIAPMGKHFCARFSNEPFAAARRIKRENRASALYQKGETSVCTRH